MDVEVDPARTLVDPLHTQMGVTEERFERRELAMFAPRGGDTVLPEIARQKVTSLPNSSAGEIEECAEPPDLHARESTVRVHRARCRMRGRPRGRVPGTVTVDAPLDSGR